MIVGFVVGFVVCLVLGRAYLIPFVLALLAVSTVASLGNGEGRTWGIPIIAFGFLTVWDLVVPHRPRRRWSDRLPRLRHPAADSVLWAWMVTQLGVLGYALHEVRGLPIDGAFAGLAVSLGVMTGGIGIVAGHELMHRRSAAARVGSEVLLATVLYTHFCIEHVQGHHVRVATAEDPASARPGESLYRFLPRAVVGGVRSAIGIERRAIAAGRVPARSLRNALVRHPLLLALALVTAVLLGGSTGLALFVAQAAFAIVLLETVNYIEHYGLERRRVDSGRYEPIADEHSWDSDHYFTNGALFNLGRHPDHHRHAARAFVDLESRAEAPRLPTGYTGMMLLATVPPLWFAVMDRRITRLAMT